MVNWPVFFQDHVNIDVITSIISASASAYVPYFLTYGIKMDTLFIYVKAFLKQYWDWDWLRFKITVEFQK